ncbi:MAG: HD domain-containing protein [Clostridiales bacterium]|nr:HD domain-containing protein [Clostridiales bacterium]
MLDDKFVSGGKEGVLPRYVLQILTLIEEAGYEAYVVGGAVRDIALGLTPHDFDVASSAYPDEMIEVLSAAGIKHVDMASRHGTVTAVTSEGNVEITAFRVDGEYSDLRRPDEVSFTRSIEEDVRRRDFTVNAMYLGRGGNICDITGGLADLERGIIRSVGEPEVRFTEDALRILRGLRFAAKYGFEIDEKTFEAMEKLSPNLRAVSGERIAEELKGLICAPGASDIIRKAYRILGVIVPELITCHGFEQHSRYHDRDVFEHTLAVLDGIPFKEDNSGGCIPCRDAELAAAAILHDLGKPESFVMNDDGIGHMKGHPEVSMRIAVRVLGELKCSKEFTENVTGLVQLHDTFFKPDRYIVHRFMSEHPLSFLRKLAVLQRADILAHSEYGQNRLERLDALEAIAAALVREGAAFSIKDLAVKGSDLIEEGVPEGPEVGKVLSEVFDAYMRGEVANDAGSMLSYIREHILTVS